MLNSEDKIKTLQRYYQNYQDTEKKGAGVLRRLVVTLFLAGAIIGAKINLKKKRRRK